MKHDLLIADDDGDFYASHLRAAPGCNDLNVAVATTISRCRLLVAERDFDLVLLDISFAKGGREGLDLIGEIRSQRPNTAVVMLTSHDDSRTINECIVRGADNFISKSKTDIRDIVAKLRAALLRRETRLTAQRSAETLAREVGAVYLSDSMKKVFADAYRARSEPQAHVLITGETGVGKDLVARAVGRESEGKPFVAINAGCISASLVESELFGHQKGAFTSADRITRGKFVLADGGDLFLDEVGDLPLEAQTKLLRVLQSGEFYRVGSEVLEKTTARVIGATNKNLLKMIEEGTFREDLYRRLVQHHIVIPPLRERKADIAAISEALIARSQKPDLKISPDLAALFSDYDWPGNVRQLEGTLSAAISAAMGTEITIGDVPHRFFAEAQMAQKDGSDCSDSPDSFDFRVPFGVPLRQAEDQFTCAYILATSKRLGQPVKIRKLSAVLQVARTSLMRRFEALGLKLIETSAYEERGRLVEMGLEGQNEFLKGGAP